MEPVRTRCRPLLRAAMCMLLAHAVQLPAAAQGIGTGTAPSKRLIVKYADDATPAASRMGTARVDAMSQAGQQFGLRIRPLHQLANGAQVVELDRSLGHADLAAVAREWKERDPQIDYVEPDILLQAALTPNDSRYAEQWHYYQSAAGIRAPAAWDRSNGSGVRVAVIDTGVLPHADLAANLLPGFDFISDPAIANDGNGRDADASDPGDYAFAGQCGDGQPTQTLYSSWHGTHVAGTLAARTNNGSGVAGVAWGARILPVRVLGRCGGYLSDIADAIVWSAGGSVAGVPANPNPARVLNLSLSATAPCSATLQSAISAAVARGAVVVVAAGNTNYDVRYQTPANCSGVVSVAAVNRVGERAWYSSFGAVDLAAPGGDTRVAGNGVLSTLNAGLTVPAGDSYAFYQGTSMAAPHVAGVAALMLARNPALTPAEVKSRLRASARPFPTSCWGCGTGIVDAAAAVNAAGGGGDGSGATVAEVEPNNALSSPHTVSSSGSTVNGAISSSSDTDYYRVYLPAGRTLSAVLTPNASSNYDLWIYNSSGNLIFRSENGTGAVESLNSMNTGANTTTRYVRVLYRSGGTGATSGRYTLRLSW